MSQTILLYGATGYSGRLIAAEGARTPASAPDPAPAYRMILAGRDGAALKKLASAHGMDFRVFGLDNRNEVLRGLRGVDVLVNAAGPFAWTAERLAKAALEAEVDYVDINGEVDVYRTLDDLGLCAAQLGRTMVCSAGHTAGVSDLLLDAALHRLRARGRLAEGQVLGSVRIAMSRVDAFSRGSAQTVWRSLREQVTVVRRAETPDGQGGTTVELALWHEPVGKLERTFDFRDDRERDGNVKPVLRIASAADLVDTLTARLTIPRHGLSVRRIESYVEAGAASRIGYQLGALLAPVAAIPVAGVLARAQIAFLPPGPTAQELVRERHVILLEIEDAFRTRVIDWRCETPNVYQLTAQIVVAVAAQLARNVADPRGGLTGWRTPAEILGPLELPFPGGCAALRGCRLDDRSARWCTSG
jgi:short subunit dehydrogenase-like uncharacterized protein